MTGRGRVGRLPPGRALPVLSSVVAMPSTSSPEDLRRWVEDRRAAGERERQQARAGGFARDPIRAALDLIAVAGRLHGWPIPEDPVRQREDELARERWARLRQALGGP